MSTVTHHFFAPLCNARGSFIGIDLGSPFRIEKWSAAKIRRLLKELDDLPDYEIDFRLEHNHCINDNQRYGFVVLAEEQSTDSDEWVSVHIRFHNIEQLMEQKLTLLRLFHDGNVRVLGNYWYSFEGKRIELESAGNPTGSILKNTCYLRRNRLGALNAFLARKKLPFAKSFLQLAFESYEESQKVQSLHLQFLSLMISLESLFNVSAQDLRYRISRGVAVLLGRDIEHCEVIMKSLKNLYDKRSQLVHTGKIDCIGHYDVEMLRIYVRKAILAVDELKIEKEGLARKLNAAGFGASIT
ncbi:MAG: HEPN domain-containing protein [Candidatus Manganitrophus sp.]|nr:HEPN domain-containing protein [Candidatus Manganitrophus sp.]MDC4224712.1 HEPN domain-containing protein [Candidatus Manganitrophus sp.]WDT70307.1 MAG: HEPN domain-containing protein [Candidatus Manganitrophus sp.]WDT78039.1 MAG: HEPN domain-containing protein [Candidatus Manganitrophus sp.]